jgi:hypothetical protein
MRLVSFLLSGLLFANSALAARTNFIIVNTNGAFTPARVDIFSGDTVVWQFPSRNDNIVPVNFDPSPAVLGTNFRAYVTTDTNEFTGPMPRAASGIYSLSPEDAPNASQPATWRDTNIVGVFIRPRWNDAHLGTNRFNWADIDREMDNAVTNGKVFSLGFKAGSSGTPQWIFSGVSNAFPATPLDFGFRDAGATNFIGSPADANYWHHYSNLLAAAAAHVRSNNARYRALAYIKIGGANLHTHENRLPNDTTNALALWATTGGYKPSLLYDFYRKQEALLAAEFPGKDMSYALIQAGFPRVSESGDYAGQSAPTNSVIPDGTEQTETILAQGRTNWGVRFVVQHNGLQEKPMTNCPCEFVHPNTCTALALAQGTPGCPNRWVIQEGQAGQVTGFQTTSDLTNLALVASAISNQWNSTDAIFLELYEGAVLAAQTNLLPSGETLGHWNERFHVRRRAMWANIADPFPLAHAHTFTRTETNTRAPQMFYYVNAARNAANGGTNFGVVAVHPDFSFTSIAKTNGQIRFTLGIANPGTNRLEISTNLVNWSVVQSGITNTGFLNFTDAAPVSATMFYRAVRLGP